MGAQLPWGKKKTDEEIAAELNLEKASAANSAAMDADADLEAEYEEAEAVQPQPQPTKKVTNALVVRDAPQRPSTALAPVRRNNDIVIHRGGAGGAIVQVRSKQIAIAGTKAKVDPYQLIRMIKRVTQNIGEYKICEDVYYAVIIGALRKARGDLVGILENEFGIHWQIDEETGRSTFYM